MASMKALAEGLLIGRAGAIVLTCIVALPPLATSQTNDSLHCVANGNLSAIAVQPDGKILVGGAFTALGGQSRHYLARLNPSGAVDPYFNPAISTAADRIILQPDGKIVAVREPVEFVNTYSIVRFKSDGATDAGFQSVANNTVNCLALQSDGKILVGGAFTTLGGVSRTVLGRLNTNGTLDTGFHPIIT